jgi:hypothetical protein
MGMCIIALDVGMIAEDDGPTYIKEEPSVKAHCMSFRSLLLVARGRAANALRLPFKPPP